VTRPLSVLTVTLPYGLLASRRARCHNLMRSINVVTYTYYRTPRTIARSAVTPDPDADGDRPLTRHAHGPGRGRKGAMAPATATANEQCDRIT